MKKNLAARPSIGLLRERLRYADGVLFWLKNGNNQYTKAGAKAGHLDRRGYVSIRVFGVSIRAHEVVWALCRGSWPQTDIDHINGIRDDNRIDNLRLSSRSQNLANSKQRSDSLKGANFDSRRNKWKSRIMVGYKEIWLGSYDTEMEAHAAYVRAARKYFKEFARAA